MRAILTYHSLDDSGSVISTPPGRFRQQMAELAASDVRVTGVQELLELDHDADAVTLTFDDGFQNFGTVAWPILRDHGLTASVFVVTQRVGGRNEWDARGGNIPSLPLLNWDTLGRLCEEGVRIGSHTRTHTHLSTLHGLVLREELEGAAETIERRLGVRPRGLAYPYGDCGGDAATAAREHYDWAVTAELRPLSQETAAEPYRLPRLDAYYFNRTGIFSRWGTGSFRGRVWLRRLGRKIRHGAASLRKRTS